MATNNANLLPTEVARALTLLAHALDYLPRRDDTHDARQWIGDAIAELEALRGAT